jgi:hypothetical protein
MFEKGDYFYVSRGILFEKGRNLNWTRTYMYSLISMLMLSASTNATTPGQVCKPVTNPVIIDHERNINTK